MDTFLGLTAEDWQALAFSVVVSLASRITSIDSPPPIVIEFVL